MGHILSPDPSLNTRAPQGTASRILQALFLSLPGVSCVAVSIVPLHVPLTPCVCWRLCSSAQIPEEPHGERGERRRWGGCHRERGRATYCALQIWLFFNSNLSKSAQCRSPSQGPSCFCLFCNPNLIFSFPRGLLRGSVPTFGIFSDTVRGVEGGSREYHAYGCVT